MTCIVGLAHKNAVWMGGDSAGVDSSYSLQVRADEKVFLNGDFILGFTSSFRMGQLLRYAFSPPEQPASMDDNRFMVTTFINTVRQCLKDGGYATTKDGGEVGGCFLVGYRGKLYEVQSDYQVARTVNGYSAVGCGDSLALGAMHATPGMNPEKRILAALQAAEQFSAGVRGPFVVLKSR